MFLESNERKQVIDIICDLIDYIIFIEDNEKRKREWKKWKNFLKKQI